MLSAIAKAALGSTLLGHGHHNRNMDRVQPDRWEPKPMRPEDVMDDNEDGSLQIDLDFDMDINFPKWDDMKKKVPHPKYHHPEHHQPGPKKHHHEDHHHEDHHEDHHYEDCHDHHDHHHHHGDKLAFLKELRYLGQFAHEFTYGFFNTFFVTEGLENLDACFEAKVGNRKDIDAGFKAMVTDEDWEAKLEGLYSVIEGIEDKPYIAAECHDDLKLDKDRLVAIGQKAAESRFLISKDFWSQNFKVFKEVKASHEFEIAGETVALNLIDAMGGPIEMPEEI
jgi:hypothetical protein